MHGVRGVARDGERGVIAGAGNGPDVCTDAVRGVNAGRGEGTHANGW